MVGKAVRKSVKLSFSMLGADLPIRDACYASRVRGATGPWVASVSPRRASDSYARSPIIRTATAKQTTDGIATAMSPSTDRTRACPGPLLGRRRAWKRHGAGSKRPSGVAMAERAASRAHRRP